MSEQFGFPLRRVGVQKGYRALFASHAIPDCVSPLRAAVHLLILLLLLHLLYRGSLRGVHSIVMLNRTP